MFLRSILILSGLALGCSGLATAEEVDVYRTVPLYSSEVEDSAAALSPSVSVDPSVVPASVKPVKPAVDVPVAGSRMLPPAREQKKAPAAIGSSKNAPFELSADNMEYAEGSSTVILRGHVVIIQGEDKMEADYVSYNRETEDAYASGNVKMLYGGRIWEGDELKYNFATKAIDTGEFQAQLDALHVRAEDARSVGENRYELKNIQLSTCDGENPDFFIRSSSASLEGERVVRAKNARFYLWRIPFFWMPYFKYDMDRHSNWDIVPGYSSRWGAFMLVGYNYRINNALTGRTGVDYRSERGLAVGQDFDWETPEMNGLARLYYASDDDPTEGKDERAEEGLVKEERYRLSLQHAQNITPRDLVIGHLNLLSDPYVTKDFFTDEYEDDVQPENRLNYTHRANQWTAGVGINHQFNDFYENVNRQPEITFDVSRQEMGDSKIYYQGNHAASFLEKVYPDLWDLESSDTYRMDTLNMFYYPMRLGGFLNLSPRAGYRGTYYENTYETISSNAYVTVYSTNASGRVEESLVLEESSSLVNAGSELRNLYELGAEMSFRAFKLYGGEGDSDEGVRHVVEPYLDYGFVPDPNVEPEQLFVYDDVDELDKRNSVRLGARNRLQTKEGQRIWDRMFLDTYFDYNLDAEEDEDELGNLVVQTELQPTAALWMKADAEFSLNGESLPLLNARGFYTKEYVGRLGGEYRYKRDERDQFTFIGEVDASRQWSGGVNVRYSFENEEVEAQTYYVTRTTRCLGYTLGYADRGSDDWDVFFQLWLTAFPDTRLRTSMGY